MSLGRRHDTPSSMWKFVGKKALKPEEVVGYLRAQGVVEGPKIMSYYFERSN